MTFLTSCATAPLTMLFRDTFTCQYRLISLSHGPGSSFKFRSSHSHMLFRFLFQALFPSLPILIPTLRLNVWLRSISMLQLSPSWKMEDHKTGTDFFALLLAVWPQAINFSFSLLLLNGNNSIYLTELLWTVSEVTHIEYLAQCLEHSRDDYAPALASPGSPHTYTSNFMPDKPIMPPPLAVSYLNNSLKAQAGNLSTFTPSSPSLFTSN